MGFEGFVGLRYLMAKRTRNVLSVITLISVAGVAVGVMALIVVLSVMGGFEGDLREKIIGTRAHIVVTGVDGHLGEYETLLRKIEAIDGVVGASAYVEGEVMANSASNLAGVVLRGIDPVRHARISSLDENIEAGGLEYLANPDALPIDTGALLQSDPSDLATPRDTREKRAANARSTLAFIGSQQARFVESVIEGKPRPARGILPPPERPELVAAPAESPPVESEPAPQANDDDDDTARSAATRGRLRANDPFLAEIDALDAEEEAAAGRAVEPSSDAGSPRRADATDADPSQADDGARRLRTNDPYLDEIDALDEAATGRDTRSPSDGARVGTLGGGMKPIPMGDDKRLVEGLILGKELRDNLAVFLGNEVNIMSPMGDVGPTGSIPKSRPYRVVGVFYSGMYEYDTKYVYTTLSSAQRFFNLGDRVTGIEIRIEDMDDAGHYKALIEAALKDHPEVVVKDWRELNGNLFSALMLEKIAMFVILTFIILVASFSILCLLIMIVIEKGREIAIFKAMGASTASIMRVFMIQGGVIGVTGTVIGATLGLLLCWVIAGWGIELPEDVYYLSHVPVEVRPLEVALICCASVLISLLATLPPSVLAARLDPVEGLRYE